MVKYPLWVQKIIMLYDTTCGRRHIDFRQMYVSPKQTTANNCKRAPATTTTLMDGLLHLVQRGGDWAGLVTSSFICV